MNQPSISFVIGAGFSVPAGYPIGTNLSIKVFNCQRDGLFINQIGTVSIDYDGNQSKVDYSIGNYTSAKDSSAKKVSKTFGYWGS